MISPVAALKEVFIMRHIEQSVPLELTRLLQRVGEKIKAGRSIRGEAKFLLPLLGKLPATFAIDGGYYIRNTAFLYFAKPPIST